MHIVDFASFAVHSDVAKVSCRLQTFDKAPGGQIGPYTLDANDSMAMHVSLQNGAIGVIHASRFASGHINDLRLKVFGTKGGLDVQSTLSGCRLRVCLADDLQAGTWAEVQPPDVPTNFSRFIAAIRSDVPVSPALSVALICNRCWIWPSCHTEYARTQPL